ncbi:hypothetical protein EDD85DRAFT_943692 [Armillaria nabsnona]|nr:hypothetical protein EDD85DRAFT_943692 [Armillaria nabsnona]
MPPIKNLNQSPFDRILGFPDAPDIETRTADWWTVMDRHTKARYDPKAPLPSHHFRSQSASVFEETTNEDVVLEFIHFRRFTSSNQLRRSCRIVDDITEEDFEKKWLALSAEEREKHFLAGLRAAEKNTTYVTFIRSKADCPELNRDEVTRDGGQGFLDLMRQLVLPDNTNVPTQPHVMVNSRFDKMIGFKEDDPHKARLAQLSMARMIRSEYIASFVMAVLMSYKGITPEITVFTTEHSKTKSTLKNNSKMFDEMMGKTASKQFKKDEVKRRKEMKLHCQRCLKVEDKEKDGKMTVCSRCKSIGREIRYCGRDCQVADWKQHKMGCGKPLDISAAFNDIHIGGSESNTKRPDIPPCPPGHRRSPHVVRLIEYLEKTTKHDYVVETTLGKNDIFGIKLDEVPGAVAFIHMRNMLFTSSGPGVEGALLYVYRVLQTYAQGGSREHSVQEQLKREYGEPLWNRMQALVRQGPPFTIPEVSRKDVDATIKAFRQLKRFTTELRSYTIGTGTIANLGLQVGPKKDICVIVRFPEDAMPPPCILVPIPNAAPKVPARNAVGPNFNLPEPRHFEDFNYHDYVDLAQQKKYLQLCPHADYILWGSNGVPLAFTYTDMRFAMAFLHYRHRLFENGPYDHDALAYLIMALRPAVRGKRIPEAVLLAQLEREYHPGYVETVKACIKARPSDGKEVYHRRDGKVFELGEIPADKTLMGKIMVQLKESGRFGDLLGRVSLDR